MHRVSACCRCHAVKKSRAELNQCGTSVLDTPSVKAVKAASIPTSIHPKEREINKLPFLRTVFLLRKKTVRKKHISSCA